MKPVDILQKAYAKIEEFKKWNSMAESAKLNYERILKDTIELENSIQSKIKKIEALDNEYSEKTSELKNQLSELSGKISDIKAKLISLEKESGDRKNELSKEIKKLEAEEKHSKEVVSLFEQKNAILLKANQNLTEESEFLKSNIKKLEEMSLELAKSVEKAQRSLRDATETMEIARQRNEAVEKREKDLKIYERRIQRYYKEAGLQIKI